VNRSAGEDTPEVTGDSAIPGGGQFRDGGAYMTSNQPTTHRDRYRIVVRGEFGELLTAAFGALEVETIEGRTVLLASVRDAQELYGLIDRLRDHGVEIESVNRDDTAV
jgi:hypothetical protein